MNHLDLFSGIGGFSLGLKKVFNIKHTYYSEIDKYAIDVYKHNFKNSTYVKSITDVQGRNLPRIDVITFGSPCQDFSLAGKRKGMDGERSSLITEAIRLIKECRPRFFIWENVKGTFSSNSGSDFWAIIQAFTNIGGYRLEWQLLNTKWFLPQNRQRIYLVGYIRNGSKGQVFPITENNRKVNDIQGQQANTCTLTTRYEAGGNGSYIIKRKLNAQETDLKQIGIIGKDSEATRVYNTNCAKTIKDGGGMGVKTGLYMIQTNNKKGYEIASRGDTINYAVPTSKTRRGRVGKGVAQTLDTGCNQAVLDNKIRRLTPIECERLQGFPDDWTKNGKELGTISDSQRYKMCGNAVTVDVVEAVAKKIKLILNKKIKLC
tara:strand:+ start:66 stop:1190 length:1125 start_codon:yes stop_codon:yes gene_type:complete